MYHFCAHTKKKRKWKVKVKSLSCVRLLATPWTAAYQAPLSTGFSSKSIEVGAIAFSGKTIQCFANVLLSAFFFFHLYNIGVHFWVRWPHAVLGRSVSFPDYWNLKKDLGFNYKDSKLIYLPSISNSSFTTRNFPTDLSADCWDLQCGCWRHIPRTCRQKARATEAFPALPAGLWHNCGCQCQDEPADQGEPKTEYTHVSVSEQSSLLWCLFLLCCLSQDAGWFPIWA